MSDRAWRKITEVMHGSVKALGRSSRSFHGSCRRLRLGLPVILVALFSSCYKSVELPCDYVRDVNERVLEIQRLSSSATNAPVPSAMLSDFSYNGFEFFSDGAARTGGGAGAEVISPSTIRCTTPCKFGGAEGWYGFLVSAEGFQPKRVEFSAKWLSKGDDCPVVLSGATVFEIALEPQP